MFQNLCGLEGLKNVALVTTMWDVIDNDEGNNRENELITKYWKTMIELGCRTSRFYNNTESALDIVSQFQDARCTTLLQRESVDLHLELAETRTSADRTLFRFRVEFIKKIKGLLAQIEVKLRQNQRLTNRRVEQEKTRTVGTLRITNVQRNQHLANRRIAVEQEKARTVGTLRRRYSVTSSVFRGFSSSR